MTDRSAGRLAFLWLLYFLFTAAYQVADGVNQALFLKRVGVAYLPAMFAAKSVVDVLVAFLYVHLAARLGHPRTLLLALLVTAGGLLLIWLPARAGNPAAYPALYAFLEGMATLLKIHWGVVLLDFYAGAAAGRSFPLIYTGARVGSVAGGLLLGPLARPLGPANLLPVSAGLYLLAAGMALGIPRMLRATEARPEEELTREAAAGRVTQLRQGLSLGLRHPLLRIIGLATAVMVLCRYGLRYLYSAAFAASFSETELARFYGLYTAVANGISVLIQAAVTSRLILHAGVELTNMLYACAVLAAYVTLVTRRGLFAAIAARGVETEIKAAVKTPLSNMFYGPFQPAQRSAARAFNLGLVVPAATIAASSLLAAAPGLTRGIATAGVFAAVLFVGATHLQNRRYAEATRGTP